MNLEDRSPGHLRTSKVPNRQTADKHRDGFPESFFRRASTIRTPFGPTNLVMYALLVELVLSRSNPRDEASFPMSEGIFDHAAEGGCH